MASQANSSMFIYHHSLTLLMVLVYVDDIIVIGSSFTIITALIKHLQSIFALKDLGDLHYFLGLEASHTSSGLHLGQSKYISNLLT